MSRIWAWYWQAVIGKFFEFLSWFVPGLNQSDWSHWYMLRQKLKAKWYLQIEAGFQKICVISCVVLYCQDWVPSPLFLGKSTNSTLYDHNYVNFVKDKNPKASFFSPVFKPENNNLSLWLRLGHFGLIRSTWTVGSNVLKLCFTINKNNKFKWVLIFSAFLAITSFSP